MARRSYMPALVAEHSETRDGRVWRVRVYSEATRRICAPTVRPSGARAPALRSSLEERRRSSAQPTRATISGGLPLPIVRSRTVRTH
jgi:hypothetical protein